MRNQVICPTCGATLTARKNAWLLNPLRIYCDRRCRNRAAYMARTAGAIEARMATIAAWQRYERNRIAS